MKITFLGTGTSCGVPFVGCDCEVCRSADPRDKRLRCSSMIEVGDKTILIDCGPDFRQQMLSLPEVKPLDAVLITHEHYDHVGGLDDLRPFSWFGEVNVYAEKFCSGHLRERIPYCFLPKDKRYPGVPAIELIDMEPHVPIRVGDVEIMPVRVMHGKLPIVGFRIQNMAYITDMSTIPDEELQYLQNLDLLIVNGLRLEKPHPSHQTVEEAVEFSKKLGARETYLIHMADRAGLHSVTDAMLPDSVHLAYDGLVVQC